MDREEAEKDCDAHAEESAYIVPCRASIVVGHETIECWANHTHLVQHMALLYAPCYLCGGYVEHHDSCAVYNAKPRRGISRSWYSWVDGDVALTLRSDDTGHEWWGRLGRGAS